MSLSLQTLAFTDACLYRQTSKMMSKGGDSAYLSQTPSLPRSDHNPPLWPCKALRFGEHLPRTRRLGAELMVSIGKRNTGENRASC